METLKLIVVMPIIGTKSSLLWLPLSLQILVSSLPALAKHPTKYMLMGFAEEMLQRSLVLIVSTPPVNNSWQSVQTRKKQTLWGGEGPCLVRYANHSIYGTLALDPQDAGYNSGDVSLNMTEFDQIWEGLMTRVIDRASSGSSRMKFATEEVGVSSLEDIYALMQCTPDLSQLDDRYRKCCYGKVGGYVRRPSCSLRWDLYPFYNASASPPAPPPPLSLSPPASPSVILLQ